MPHSDHETLDLLALGEPVPTADTEHVASCDECAEEVRRSTAVVTAVRAGTGFGEDLPAPVQPPPSVWTGIAAWTGVTTAPRPRPLANGSSPARADREAAVRHPVTAPAPAPAWVPPAQRDPHNRRTLLIAAAALVAGLVAGGAGAVVLRPDDPAPPAATRTLTSASLAGLPLAPAASGRAEVVQTAAGRHLVLDVSSLAPPDGFYEVWLIDPSVSRMYAVGVLRGPSGEFTLPDGVNLQQFPIVDISEQPLNGDPAHSGRSVLRGTLPT